MNLVMSSIKKGYKTKEECLASFLISQQPMFQTCLARWSLKREIKIY